MLAVSMVAILLVPQYVSAVAYTDYTQDINFVATGSPDEVQNSLDPNEESNYDTWSPVPQGVWFGGWMKESRLQLSEVPDTDCSAAMAQVCYFGSEVIMSGSSKFTVRLPLYTTTSTWSKAQLSIYQVDRGTNWTFVKNASVNANGDPHYLNDMRVTFTEGNHQLIYWSQYIYPNDTSPTDGNDYFTRLNRTYVEVAAPIHANTYYLFLTTAWFNSDQYIEIYWQPDSLDSSGVWNRSTLGIHNEQAPDTYTLDVYNYNISFGYSFDFVDGLGESSCGLNTYVYSGTELRFYTYLDPDNVDTSHYPTLMVPYRSQTKNLSISCTVYAMDHGDYSTAVVLDNIYQHNGYVLFSSSDTLANNISALANFTGWFYVILQINNDTRIRFSLWDLPPTDSSGFNSTWFEDWHLGSTYDEAFWVHDNEYNWNPLELVYLRYDSEIHIYHFQVMHSFGLNEFYWQKAVATDTGGTEVFGEENTTSEGNFWYGLGKFFFNLGTVVMGLNAPYGTAFRAIGIIYMLTSESFSQYFGNLWDKLRGVFSNIGSWAYRIGQAIIGVINFFIDLASVILALFILILSMVVFFTPIFFTVKGGMAIRKAILGDFEGAADELKGAAAVASKMVKTSGKVVGRGG